ncbi:sensor domain-containing diguanylate cyclase [Massilia agilis]|uniref:diguanylate cyclase n=1 Tax=Massilia agilis TaxID=1811226 RepID=A0ABT2DDL8_9BURK|nr:sensor domain-containing diguanylate cyclase [Massilia agilis]MCS0809431.1 sensor domain-containing diguanylate cyclase [Massilia agilis]
MHDGAASRELIAENEALRARMADLIRQAERNHEIMCRHQAFDLEIVGASSFPQLVGTIFRTLPAISELDVVTLTLVDPDADIYTVMLKLGVDFEEFPNLMFSEAGDELGFDFSTGEPPRPQLGPFDRQRHAPMFPAACGEPRSVALVPLLRNKRLIGCLNLGSLDATRFAPEMGTDFIEHMASIIAICLENVISNEMLKYIGLTDALTGVYNRRYVDRRLLEEISRARRNQSRLSVMYIDIDHFKQINDSVGHQGGDDVLREVASRIKAELRISDALARFGGEEFVVLLVDADGPSAAVVAGRIRAGVADTPVELAGGQAVPVTVSIGVATLDLDERSLPLETVAQQLLAQADAALYRAKQAGRNRVIACV